MIKTFNTLIIGAGGIGAFNDSPQSPNIITHAHAFAAHKGFTIVGFYDINFSKANKAAKIWGGESFKSLAEAFRKNKIDVISVAVPDQSHYSMLRKIIKYNPKIVFVEKPLTTTEHNAEKIVKLYKRYRIPLSVNYSRRFIPEFINEKKRINNETYGKYIGGVGYYGKGILHNGSHMVNTLRFLLGKITLDSVVDSEPDFYNSDPSVSAVLKVNDKKKFFMHHVSSNLYTIFEFDLLFERARIRIVDSGFKIERYLKRKNLIFTNYFNVVKDQETNTSLGLSCYSAVDNIYNFLKGRDNLLSGAEEALEDVKLCLAISKKGRINKRILLFSHDPGGANMVLPLVKPLKDKGYKVFLYGKKYSLVKYSEHGLKGLNIARNLRKTTPENVEEFLKSVSPHFVITGTSSDDMTERYLWQAASKLNIPSFAILDSWLNYEIRFSANKDGGPFFPTKICVVDNAAKAKVFIDGLTEDMLLITGNPFHQFLLEKNSDVIKRNLSDSKNLKKKSTITILFVSEPISKFYKKYFGSEEYMGYTEKTIFSKIYKSIQKTFEKSNTKIKFLIKLHPQDDRSNFDDLIKKLGHNPNITIKKIGGVKNFNWDLINSSDIVCGMGSALLVQAFLLGKPVLSVFIGLKKDFPSVFDKAGMMKRIHSQAALDNRFRNLIENKITSKYNNKAVGNPIRQLISNMEKILWQN